MNSREKNSRTELRQNFNEPRIILLVAYNTCMCERTKQNIKRNYASFRGICTIKEQSDPALYKDLTNQGYFYEKQDPHWLC